jgi:hypothetical protein
VLRAVAAVEIDNTTAVLPVAALAAQRRIMGWIEGRGGARRHAATLGAVFSLVAAVVDGFKGERAPRPGG